MRFGFVLASSDIYLRNIDLLDTHLDLLDTDIPSKHFVCLQDILNITIFCLSRRLEYNFKTSSRSLGKTKNCCTEDILRTSSKHV